MASTYVNNLRLEEIGSGEQSGSWGDTTNTNLEIIGQAVAWGTRAIANASTDNITIADGALDADRCLGLKLTGGGQACTVTLLPNTSSKTWFMYNATSYTLTFTCGSGANVAILAGETKVIATDGLGSGGVVHDLLTGVNLAGTTKVDDLVVGDDATVTDDLIVGGDIDLEGSIDVNGTANLDVVDIDGAVDMASTLTVAGVLTGASLDISGDIDVDGTANLDIVDIDGAVNMATTALITGILTTTAATVFNGGFASNADSTVGTDKKIQFRDAAIYINSSTDGQLDIVADTEIQIAATTIDINGAINASGEIIAASLDISGAIDIAGNSVLASVDVTGLATAATFEPDGDTAAGDNAAIGYTAAEGLILTGQGSTNDVTIKNDADADVIEIPTGTTSVTMTGSLKPLTYQETYVASSAASTVTLDLATATSFSLTMDQATTFAFSNPPGSGTAFSFTLFLTQHSTAVAITWPGTVDWAGGSAPDAAAADALQAYAFFTRDGGTTYYGFLGGTAIA